MEEKGIEDGVKGSYILCPYRTLSPSFTVIAVARILLFVSSFDLPTCLHLAQSTCVFDVIALSFSLAFHESIANMYQVIDGFYGARFESAIRYRVKT